MKTVYQAFDGRLFEKYGDCREYEENLWNSVIAFDENNERTWDLADAFTIYIPDGESLKWVKEILRDSGESIKGLRAGINRFDIEESRWHNFEFFMLKQLFSICEESENQYYERMVKAREKSCGNKKESDSVESNHKSKNKKGKNEYV